MYIIIFSKPHVTIHDKNKKFFKIHYNTTYILHITCRSMTMLCLIEIRKKSIHVNTLKTTKITTLQFIYLQSSIQS